jgi:TonB family protein
MTPSEFPPSSKPDIAQSSHSPYVREGNTVRHSHDAFSPEQPHYLKLIVDNAAALRRDKALTLWGMGISGLSHIAVVGLFVLAYLLLDMFNWRFSLFELPDLTLNRRTEIEYVIVNNRLPEIPRDPKTKNRAEVASRAGGIRQKRPVASEAQRQAGGAPSALRQAQSAASGEQAVREATPPVVISPSRQPNETSSRGSSSASTTPRTNSAASSTTPVKEAAPTPSKSSKAGKVAGTPKKQAVVRKPSGGAIAPGSASPKKEAATDIGWDDAPGPIMTQPAGGGATRGNTGSKSGGAKRIGSGGQGNSQSQPASAANVKGAGGNGALNTGAGGNGGGGLAGVDALPEPDMSGYISNVRNRVARNWNRPQTEGSKTAIFAITLSRSGGLISANLITSSGVDLFDQKARAAITAGAPFGSVPAGFRGSNVTIQFSFSETVSGG